MRRIEAEYQDPLDLIWTVAAKAFGLTVERSSEVFAATNGSGVLKVGTSDTLDSDDSLAQIILHELCHFFVEGYESLREPDWGLDISSRSQRSHELGALRLQAFLANRYGLRKFFASTTDFRNYFDLVPEEALSVEIPDEQLGNYSRQEDQQAMELARNGLLNLEKHPAARTMDAALATTRTILDAVRPFASKPSLWCLS